MPPNNDDLNRLEGFLACTDNQTKAEAMADLAFRGVNPSTFKARVAEVVRKGYQSQVKLAAQVAKKDASGRATRRFGDLVSKSFADLNAIFERIRAGEFGAGCQEAALARCRNMQSDDPSEAELRSWLEDISTLDDQ